MWAGGGEQWLLRILAHLVGRREERRYCTFSQSCFTSPAILHTDWVVDCGCGGSALSGEMTSPDKTCEMISHCQNLRNYLELS